MATGLPTVAIPPRSSLPFTGVGLRKRAAFYMQLARMMQAGIGIGRCLSTLAGQGGSRRLATAAAAMARHVQAGNPLAEAFAQHPNIFLPNEVRVIEGASRAGREPDAMLAIARLLERLASARNRVLAGLIYPALCLWVAFCGIPLLIAYLTRGPDEMLRVLWGQVQVSALAAAVLFAVVVAFRSIPTHSDLRVGLHGAALFVPLFGKTYRRLALARFADAFHGPRPRQGAPTSTRPTTRTRREKRTTRFSSASTAPTASPSSRPTSTRSASNAATRCRSPTASSASRSSSTFRRPARSRRPSRW